MRTAALFFVAVLFIIPSAVRAEEPADSKPVTGSNDRCLDESLKIDDGKPVITRGRTDTEQYKTCRDISGGCTFAKEKAKQCVCGTMKYTTLEKKTISLDKCDPDMRKKLAKAMGGGAEGMQTFATQAVITDRIEKIDVSTEEGRGQLSQILQSYGVSEADADAKVSDAGKASDVQAQLQKFVSTSDNDVAKQVADNLGLKLNGDLTDAVRLDPNKYAAVLTEEELAGSQPRSSDTFPEPKRLVIEATGQPSAPMLPGNKINPTVLGTIAADAQRRVCAAVQGTCYVTREAQFATMMNETPGDVRLYGDGGRSTSLAQVYQPTANSLLGKYQALYGEEYQLNRVNLNDSSLNPEWIASQSLRMQALVIQEKGNQTGGDYGRMLAAYNGGGYAAAVYGMKAYNNTNLLTSGNASSYWQSSFNAAGEALANGPAITNLAQNLPTGGFNAASPFGNANRTSYYGSSPYQTSYGSPIGGSAPVGTASYGNGNVSPSQPTGSSGSQTNTQPTPTSPSQSQTQTGSQGQPDVAKQLDDAVGGGDAKATVGASPASVLAQPSEVTRGNPITVSWTSVGMSADKPCVLRANSTFITQKNQGSVVVPTTQATQLGSLIFTLTCTTASGAPFQRTAAVMVR